MATLSAEDSHPRLPPPLPSPASPASPHQHIPREPPLSPSSPSGSTAKDAAHDALVLEVHHRGQVLTYSFADDNATISDLSQRVQEELLIPPENQKYMITPKIGLIKHPFPHPDMSLAGLAGTTPEGGDSSVRKRKTKIVLFGATTRAIASLHAAAEERNARNTNGRLSIPPAKPSIRHRVTRRTLEQSTYTFNTLRPLPHLPNPERSVAYLARLRDDPGIKAAMRSHRWTVPLLSEMDPAEHTSLEARTLGVNHNHGEEIGLRLRTDAYDGYRDYKTIRKTLCHELAHNVHGDHDQDFWRLCREVEREVDRNDYLARGRTVGDEEYYNPPDQGGGASDGDDARGDGGAGGGGWYGGEYVVGQGSSAASGAASSQLRPKSTIAAATKIENPDLLSRRNAMARAAEQRRLQQEQPPPQQQQQQQPEKE
ncbi:MAG: hypothetical protein M1815_000385 [Lichina confinis]|nr:MAG: hypothetical protein M1815_000385 [Lichina confinis]